MCALSKFKARNIIIIKKRSNSSNVNNLSSFSSTLEAPITPTALELATQKSCCIRKLISSKNSSIIVHQKAIYHVKDKNPGDEKLKKKGGGDMCCDSQKSMAELARRKYLFAMTLVKSAKYLEAPNIAFNVLIPWKNQ